VVGQSAPRDIDSFLVLPCIDEATHLPRKVIKHLCVDNNAAVAQPNGFIKDMLAGIKVSDAAQRFRDIGVIGAERFLPDMKRSKIECLHLAKRARVLPMYNIAKEVESGRNPRIVVPVSIFRKRKDTLTDRPRFFEFTRVLKPSGLFAERVEITRVLGPRRDGAQQQTDGQCRCQPASGRAALLTPKDWFE